MLWPLNSKIITNAGRYREGARGPQGLSQVGAAYPPDVAKNKAQAEDKFKEINEAYEVLMIPEKGRNMTNWAALETRRRIPRRRPAGGLGGRRTARLAGGEYEFHGGTGFSDF